jgi:hypothetical protein
MDSRDATETVKVFDTIWPPASLTRIVKVYEPTAGVPDIMPDVLSARPLGRLPAARLQA